VPADNPFVGTEGALPEIYSYGHRNVQGILVEPETGRVYSHEHGARGGDELNLIEPGVNYGWPAITYGIDYSGAIISPYTEREGMAQPLLHWTPSIAPSGLALYSGEAFPAWQGDFLVSALSGARVERIDMEDGVPVGRTALFDELNERIRDVRAAPDGSVYLLTDDSDGAVLRVVPVAP
jgi:glucose/arabinose dehydrogenase